MNEKQKLAAVVVILAAVAAGLLYLIYKERGYAVVTRKSIEDCRTAIKLAEAKIAEIPALEAERNRLTQFVEEYVRILPDEKEVEALLETLSELKDQSGLAADAIESFQFVAEPARERGATSANFQKYIRQVQLRATLFQFATFVNLLERYKRFIQVDSFAIRPGTQGAEMEISMQMSTFTYSRMKKK